MKLLAIFLAVVIMFSCSNSQVNAEPESFDSFNARFHSDTVFQLSRIAFPIGGNYADGFEQYKWTKNNWQYLRVPVMEEVELSDYKHAYEKTDSTVMEKYWIDSSGFKVEVRFKLIDGKWFLVYYDDQNL